MPPGASRASAVASGVPDSLGNLIGAERDASNRVISRTTQCASLRAPALVKNRPS
jgi:hypothetical protein